MRRRIILLLLCAAMILSLTACSTHDNAEVNGSQNLNAIDDGVSNEHYINHEIHYDLSGNIIEELFYYFLDGQAVLDYTKAYSYDDDNNLLKVTRIDADSSSQETLVENDYSETGKLLHTYENGKLQIENEYDGNDNLISSIEYYRDGTISKSETRIYSSDGLLEKTTATYYEIQEVQTVEGDYVDVPVESNVISEFDTSGRLIKAIYDEDEPFYEVYTYDNNSTICTTYDVLDNSIIETDETHYDDMGRIIKTVSSFDDHDYEDVIEYNDNSIIVLSYSNGELKIKKDLTYNSHGLLVSASRYDSNEQLTGSLTCKYDSNDRIVSFESTNQEGNKEYFAPEREYDSGGHLKQEKFYNDVSYLPESWESRLNYSEFYMGFNYV